MTQRAMDNPQAVLREAVGGNRVVGVVAIGLGIAFFAPAAMSFPNQTFAGTAVAVSASVFLIAPGIVYQIAASGMKHRAERAGQLSMRVAIAQSITSVIALGGMAMFRGYPGVVCLVPPLVNLFFVPAALVQAFKISRAIHAIRLLPFEGRAFEAIAVQPVPVKPMPVQTIETDLEK